MKKLILAVILVWSSLVSAVEMKATIGQFEVTLGDTPCTAKVILDQIKPEFRKQFQSGIIKEDGELMNMCWTVNPFESGSLFLVDEYGFTGNIPMVAFAPKNFI